MTLIQKLRLKIISPSFLLQVEEYVESRGRMQFVTDKDVLVDFVLTCKKKHIEEVDAADINIFRDCVINNSTPYAAINSMKAIRCLFRYHRSKGLICIHPSFITDNGVTSDNDCDIKSTMKKGATIPKVDRNKEIVMNRVKDPATWTYGELADHYGVSRNTAYDLIKRHIRKFASPDEIKGYEDKLRNLGYR